MKSFSATQRFLNDVAERTLKPMYLLVGDEGFFRYYAGGSYVNNANGHCVTWGGSVGNFSWYSSAAGVHCG